MTIQRNVDLQPYNTFGIAAKARLFCSVSSVEEIQELIHLPSFKENRVLILGGGSNVLLRNDFDGLVVQLATRGIRILSENDKHIHIAVQAGEKWHDLVMYCTERDWGGIENLALIPGSVGAAPMQNIGAYGVEVKDCFNSLVAVHRESGVFKTFTKADCAFGYRESVFKKEVKDEYIITEVGFLLTKKDHKLNTEYGAIQEELATIPPTIKTIRDAVIRIRTSKLPNPSEIGNSGSFFKNPVVSNAVFLKLKARFPNIAHYTLPDGNVKLAAGWLIEQAGFKGHRQENGAGVHDKQALVLVNHGAATGEAIYELSNQIITKIKDEFDVDLDREVNLI